MTGKLLVNYNGRDMIFTVDLTEEQIEKLRAAMNVSPDNDGWQEPQVGGMGFYEDEFNQVVGFEITEDTLEFAKELYENDNFFSTEETAKNTVRADNILRRLRHYAITHRKTDTKIGRAHV